METVFKKDLINNIAKKSGLSREDVTNVVDSFLEEIEEQYMKGTRVDIRGFGRFFPYFRKSRTYQDPVSKKIKPMKDKYLLKFRAAKRLFIEA